MLYNVYLFVFIENGDGRYQISCKLVNFIHKFASNQQVISGVTNFLRVDRKWREGRSFPVLRETPLPPPESETRTFQIIQDTIPLDWFNSSPRDRTRSNSSGFTTISILRSYIFFFLPFFFLFSCNQRNSPNNKPRSSKRIPWKIKFRSCAIATSWLNNPWSDSGPGNL